MLFFVKTFEKHFTKTKQKSIKNASNTILPLKNNIIIQMCKSEGQHNPRQDLLFTPVWETV